LRYQFDWDLAKEAQNLRKHSLDFRRAATVFNDPHHLSTFDEEHSEHEDRWITLGQDNNGILRVVVHTFEQVNENQTNIRIISARKATNTEADQYSEGIE
jgi:uncharacterized DUF497 family protein